MRRPKRTLLTALGLVAFLLRLLTTAQPAQAHSAFVRSEPAPNSVLATPPPKVTIWFSKPLEPALSEIRVLNMHGERVDDGDSRLLTGEPGVMSVSLSHLSAGTYTVVWRNLSVDGHARRGSFVFSIGQPLDGAGAAPVVAAANQSTLKSLIRSVMLIAAMALVGGFTFDLLLIRPFFFTPESEPFIVEVGRTLRRRWRQLARVSLIVLVLASLLQLLQQAVMVFDIPILAVRWSTLASVLDTSWGRLWMVRFLLFSIVFSGLTITTAPIRMVDNKLVDDFSSQVAPFVVLLGGVGILLTFSMTSHATAMEDLRMAAISSDLLHLLAAAVWIGGLFQFAFGARPLFRAVPSAERQMLLSNMVPRFSILALLSVGTLTITGLYSGWIQVLRPEALVTPYGLTLLAKVGLFLPMLLLGAFNLLWTSPRLGTEKGASSWLRRSISIEAFLGLLILIIAGFLSTFEPARQTAAREGLGQSNELSLAATVDNTDINLTVEPALVGNNRFLVELHDAQGRPISNATDVVLTYTYLGTQIGEQLVALQPAEAGQYVAEGVLFSVAGDWQVQVFVSRPGAANAQSTFSLDVQPASSPSPDVRTGYILWGVELLLLGILLLAVSVAQGHVNTRRGLALAIPGTLALVAGLFLAVINPLLLNRQAQSNPYPPSAQSLRIGKLVYIDNCQPCHGATGLGDGPTAASLNPKPANLASRAPLHADVNLFTIVQHGVPNTSMPAFSDRLSTENTWHLINYLRKLSNEASVEQ